MEELLRTALDHALFAGASYVDARAVEVESETISVTGPTVEALDTGHSIGFCVRVLADGAWGHAASARLEPTEFERVAQAAVEVARGLSSSRSRCTGPGGRAPSCSIRGGFRSRTSSIS
jgi:TldD protein